MRNVFRGSHGRTLAPALLLACTLLALALFARGKHHAGVAGTVATSQPLVPAPPGSAGVPPLRAALVPAAAAASVSAPSFTMHGGTRRQHRAESAGPAQPTLRWKTAVGGPVAAQVAVNGARSVLYVATLAGDLVSLGFDGSVRWRKSLGGRMYGTPTIGNDGTIYVGSDAGKFFALRENGDEAWKFDADEEVDTGALVRSDGSIVFTAGKSLFGLRRNGTVLFRSRLRKKSFAAVAELPGGDLVVAAQDHRVHVFSAGGDERTSVDLGADVDGAPAIGDAGEIYVGTDAGEVVSLLEGRIRWRASVGGFVRGALSLGRNGDVLVGTYGPRPRMLRLAGSDGQILGAFSIQGTGAKEFGIHGGPIEDAAGRLYFGAQDDRVYAIGPEGLLWSYATGADVDAPVTLLPGGALVVGSYDGFVYAFGGPN